MDTPTPDNAARAQDGSTDERIIQRNALNDLLDNLSHDAGDVDDFAPSIEEDEDAYWAYHQYHGIVSLRRTAATVTALEAEVASLQASLDRLSGMKFSDRMHAALVSRADTAERRVAELEANDRRYRFLRDGDGEADWKDAYESIGSAFVPEHIDSLIDTAIERHGARAK